MAAENLEQMKYSELQRIAKENGIKANMKADKLIKAITEYLSTQQNDVQQKGKQDTKDLRLIIENKDSETDEPAVVTKPAKRGRRGRKKKTSSKSSDKETSSESEDKTTDDEQAPIEHVEKPGTRGRSQSRSKTQTSRANSGPRSKTVEVQPTKGKSPRVSHAKTSPKTKSPAPTVMNKSRTPTGSNRAKTPTGIVKKSKTPTGIVNKAKTPIGAVNKAKTPIGAVNKAKTPIGAVNKAKTPIGAVNKAKTPIGAVNKAKTPIGAVNKAKTPIGAVNKAKTPIGAVNKAKAATNIVNKTKTPIGVRTQTGVSNKGKTPIVAVNRPGVVAKAKTPSTGVVRMVKTPAGVTKRAKTPVAGVKTKTPGPMMRKAKTPQSAVITAKTPASRRAKPVISKKVAGKRSVSRSRAPKSAERKGRTPTNSSASSSKPAGGKRKRTGSPKLNSTYELEDGTAQAEDEKKAKKAKRGTFEVIPDVETEEKTKVDKSPAGKGVLNSLKPEMSGAQIKTTIMAALDKKVEAKRAKAPADHTSTSIPRFAAFLAKRREAASCTKKPVTPGNKDWDKIHKRNFSKMDSIDSYLEKKRKRIETFTTSVKKAKLMAAETRTAVERLKNRKVNNTRGAKVARPATRKSQPESLPFLPTVTTTTTMNLNFGSAKPTRFSAGKSGDQMKTPANAKPVKPATGMKENAEKRNSTSFVPNRKSLTGIHFGKKTPFKAVDTSIAQSPKKPVFDLKASLSKPLTWKPYTGRVKAMDGKKPAVPTTKTPSKDSVKQHQSLVKKRPGPQTTQDRRKAAQTHRANKKLDDQMRRRGIVA